MNFVKGQDVVMIGKVTSFEPLNGLMEVCCGRMKLRMSQVRFMVAGERTIPSDSAEQLRLDLRASNIIEVVLEQHGGGPGSSPPWSHALPKAIGREHGAAGTQLLVPKAKAVARLVGAAAPVSPKGAPPKAAAVTSTALVLPKAAVLPLENSLPTVASDEKWTGKQWQEVAGCFASLPPPVSGFTWAVSRTYRHMLQMNMSWLKNVPAEFLFQVNVADNTCRYHADAPLLRSESHSIIPSASAAKSSLDTGSKADDEVPTRVQSNKQTTAEIASYKKLLGIRRGAQYIKGYQNYVDAAGKDNSNCLICTGQVSSGEGKHPLRCLLLQLEYLKMRASMKQQEEDNKKKR